MPQGESKSRLEVSKQQSLPPILLSQMPRRPKKELEFPEADAHYRLTNWKAYLSRTMAAASRPRLLPKPTSLRRQLPSTWWTPSRQPPQRSGTAASSWAPVQVLDVQCSSNHPPNPMCWVSCMLSPTASRSL